MKKTILSFFATLATMFLAHSQTNALDSSVERGHEIYKDFCINCHLLTGEGVVGVFPPLAKSDFLIKNRIESIRAIKFGLQGEIVVNGKTYNSIMAPLGLSDDEVADVMNYINNSWGNTNDKIVTEEEVSKIEKQ
tara:strand:+ start:9923 stop:10327 length:405 start_codon:yes stop_codon:yes gene_type:complete